MTTASSSRPTDRRGTLDDYLAPDDIISLPTVPDEAWASIRRAAGRQIVWRFLTLRNLVVHRGRFLRDTLGFAWGGIYRTLLVSSIVATSYRNEGLVRAGERIFGTSDFFWGSFVFPRSSNDLRSLVEVVNLRHHVAGVVIRQSDGARVIDGYEADYAYVATAFIESIRRGLALCGLSAESARGRAFGEQLCTVLYQVAGLTGLTRVPRDLAAHERFRDAYDRTLRERPPSSRVRRMAQEIAHRIAPLTAERSGETVRGHVRRHIDPETAQFLFPGGVIPEELERHRDEWCRRLRRDDAEAAMKARAATRQIVWQRPDVAALRAAYRTAPSDLTADRLIGSILLHELDTHGDDARPIERRSIELAPGETIIRQGQTVGEMYVLLSTTAPLIVVQSMGEAAEPRQVATLSSPTVLGEIGMWRGQPAVATVMTRETNRLDVLVIDAKRFASLKEQPGFRAATAAEVQRRLAINAALVGTLLDDTAANSGDPRLASIAQLFRYLTGDSHVALDRVIDLVDDATPAECLEALREQVDDAIASGGIPPDLERYLRHVVATIG
ncbi:MAG: cyclic nucleotide-binding domain-containing protein [Planctomycetia bacterium]